ncbi:MAG: transpeptidase family protein [Treponema sp.]|nr:transpeptidase family protein [Treponema sp.]MCL2251772.1 transpeptidase family protein [Treponema sp.]
MHKKIRFIFFFILFGGLAASLLVYYAVLMTKGEVSPPPRQIFVYPDRGSILDRNGRFLAVSIRFADVGIWIPTIPKPGNIYNLPDLNEISQALSGILEMTPEEIRNKVSSAATDYVFLKKQIDDSTARRVSEILREKRIRCVIVQPVVGRIYPERNLASQVIGFVGDMNKGLEGIEFAFNDILDGVNNDGNGSQLVLTIDTYVQHILEEISLKTMKETQAEAVMFVAMDPRSGEILGSASLPDFDPNNIKTSNAASRMNRPGIWAFEPGSTFKVFSLAALMDSGVISGNTAFICNGVYTPNRGPPINCMGNHGRVTAREIIIHSCNAGAAFASDNINSNNFYQLLSKFGFGSRTGAGTPGETAGYLVPSSSWSDRSKPTIAFGQEIAVSAYQILKASTAIANDGILVSPKIISKIISADGKTTEEWKNGEQQRILKAETARAMRSYMVDTASSIGTGWRAAVQDMSLAVKTGTAQIIDPETRRYSSTDFIASCIALLPAEAPTLVLYLAVIKPQGQIFGARIATPAIREAAEALIDYIGIPRGRNPQVTHPSAVNIPAGQIPVMETHVPNYTGVSKRLLIPLLLRDDVNVEIRGDGWVRRQSPPAGTPVTEGMNLILELE